MRLHLALLAGALLVCTAGSRADDTKQPPSPLRLIPAEAEFLVHAPRPHEVANIARKLELVAQIQDLFAAQLDTTSTRRAAQLLAHFEKKLGEPWPALLEKLAGGGIALAGKFEADAPALLVVQGTDEKLTKQAVELFVEIIEEELARQESKDKVEKKSEKGVDGYKVGDGLFIARMGAAVVISNKKEALAKSILLHLGTEKKSLADHPAVAEAQKLLPEKPLVEAWIDMRPAHESEGGKALYKSPRDDATQTVLFGQYLDILGRTPFLAAALTKEKDDFSLTIRAPRGRDGMGPDAALHLPPDGKPGCKPLLEPKGVLYSSSFYLDVSKIWQDREKLFTPQNAKGLTDTDKNSAPFLFGTKLSTLLETAGTQHRVVVANQGKTAYKRQSKVTIPSFAFVADARDGRKFWRTMDVLLRAFALTQTEQFGLQLAEETHSDVDIVAYRFDEKKELPDDANDVRFAFSPCYARVKEHVIFCSTIELCRDLIDELKKQEKNPGKMLDYTAHDRYYASGFAELLRGQQDQLVTQAILDQAVAPDEAKKQVAKLIAFVKGQSDVTSYSEFKPKEWRYEFRLGLK